MRILLLVLTILISVVVGFGQSNDALAKLKNYKITLYDMTLNLQPTSGEYAFEMQYSVHDSQYPVNYLAIYDPAKTPSWKMTSWNGNSNVEKYQANSLYDRVARLAKSEVLVDEATLEAAMDGDYLIISFRVLPETVPKQYAYIKDCNGKAYINTRTSQLEKTVWENFKSTKNGVVRISKIHEEISFVFFDGVYHVEKETQFINGRVQTKVGEKNGTADQVITYDNYIKSK